MTGLPAPAELDYRERIDGMELRLRDTTARLLARRFRDEAGLLNQQVASVADSVYLVTAGLPQKLK